MVAKMMLPRYVAAGLSHCDFAYLQSIHQKGTFWDAFLEMERSRDYLALARYLKIDPLQEVSLSEEDYRSVWEEMRHIVLGQPCDSDIQMHAEVARLLHVCSWDRVHPLHVSFLYFFWKDVYGQVTFDDYFQQNLVEMRSITIPPEGIPQEVRERFVVDLVPLHISSALARREDTLTVEKMLEIGDSVFFIFDDQQWYQVTLAIDTLIHGQPWEV